jgi:hypothetical protein
VKATLEFELPEEQQQFNEAADGWKWRRVVQDMDEKMRGVAKHGNAKETREAQRWRKELADVIRCRDLSLYD